MRNRDVESRLRELEIAVFALQSVMQLPSDATLADVIIAINKMTNSMKRRR